MLELVLAVSIAIFVSAMCSLFEAVLYSTPISHIEMMVASGRKSGELLRDMRAEVHRPISAILTLNTVANTAGAAVAGAAALAVFGHHWLVYFSAAFTLSILIFSEVLPKTAGVVYARPLSSIVARPLHVLVWLLTPAIWLCQFAARTVSRRQTEPEVTAAEIRILAKMSRRSGEIRRDEERVIENILALKTKKAHQIMTPRTVVFTLSAHLKLSEARKKAGLWPHGRVPVYDESPDDIVGIAIGRDVFNAIADGHLENKLSELMVPAHFVPEQAGADRLLREFLERRQHMFVVMDEYGGFSGVVTLEDVLEEIVGREIVDEHDSVADMRELARERRKKVMEKKDEKK
jgi:CBS domain containing-hemolysin-like protein